MLAKQEESRKWLFEEAEILDHLETLTGYNFGSVNSYMLFGSRGLSYGDSMGYGKIQPTLEDLRKIASVLKPVPMIRISSGCCSFEPEETAEPREYDKVTKVAPFNVTLNTNNRHYAIADVSWYTKILGKLYRVNIYITDKGNDFGNIYWRRYEYAGGWSVRDAKCNWQIDDIFRDGNRIAEHTSMVWGTGSDQAVPQYTMYWRRVGRYVATPVDMVNGMLEVINA